MNLLVNVSILVLVDVGLRHKNNHPPPSQNHVSILVLVDVGLRQCNSVAAYPPTEVSILVLVDVGLRLRPGPTIRRNLYVSILVLVDVGLRHSGIEYYTQNEHSFNPCFSGCWSATYVQQSLSDHTP